MLRVMGSASCYQCDLSSFNSKVGVILVTSMAVAQITLQITLSIVRNNDCSNRPWVMIGGRNKDDAVQSTSLSEQIDSEV